ncbi:MAG: imidazoleglycerol-phosphate dehydratase HisB, partial [Alphaproteobacteria bacterium]|nr:imidazoleglycerol-phosphate dehydratase HisB [Alphaproteobacteria bacterium]
MTQDTRREATFHRKTNETDIQCAVVLDGAGEHDIATGVGFFDHMLAQLARHGLLDLTIQARGDLHIDAHHLVEDTGYTLGTAIRQALGDKLGITRYGDALIPMDETLVQVAVDLSGRPYLVENIPFSQPTLGTMDTELFHEFFEALAQSLGAAIHINVLRGRNNHHMIEASFKGLARALR